VQNYSLPLQVRLAVRRNKPLSGDVPADVNSQASLSHPAELACAIYRAMASLDRWAWTPGPTCKSFPATGKDQS
jgi:hypothetical protein